MLLKRVLSATAVAAAIAGSFAFASPAMAADSDYTCAYTHDSGGKACYASEGDHFYVEDNQVDGHGIRVRYKFGTGGAWHYIHYTGGYTQPQMPVDYNFDFTNETATIYFQVGEENAGTYVDGTYGTLEHSEV
ncbi:MAG TPA: hypothetical protein VGN37_15725 [Actinocatenispora sp.]